MRLVSQQITDCLGNDIPVQANFGLIFNKWLDYRKNKDKLEPVVAQDRSKLVAASKTTKKAAGEILRHHHIRQAEFCLAMEKAGWKSFVFHARLTAPFVSDLGASHPTETGLVLDRTSGMPYIPAAGQKGVLRIAHLINSLKDGEDWLSEDVLIERDIIDKNKNWLEDDASMTMFGSGGNTDALAGQLTILDAYPLEPPELGEDILNPHYRDYYEGKRGPTEDQSPVPIKFLVVKPGTEFVFRLLLRTPFPGLPDKIQDKLPDIIMQNMQQALTEVGMGAKTALGFGRFSLIKQQEPDKVLIWIKPWLNFIRNVKNIKDWSQFKQVVLEADIPSDWKVKQDVGKIVKAAASRVHKTARKKWTEERDQAVSDWLKPSGVEWQPLAIKKETSETAKPSDPMVEKIQSCIDQDNYDRSIDILSLNSQCCQLLQQYFKKKGWHNRKRAKKNNHALWKRLQARRKQLRSQKKTVSILYGTC